MNFYANTQPRTQQKVAALGGGLPRITQGTPWPFRASEALETVFDKERGVWRKRARGSC